MCKRFTAWGMTFVAIAGILASANKSRADDFTPSSPGIWPEWRGAGREGQFIGPTWPESMEDNHLRRIWRVELGPSYSGPIVAEDRVFTTETVDEAREVIRALDRKTGKELWRTDWPGAIKVPFFAARNGSWIRSTPAYDGASLFVGGIEDILVRLDADTGRILWRVDFCDRYGTDRPDFGLVCSPMVVGEHVYLQAADSFLKINKQTGLTVWRVLQGKAGMFEGGAFSSPVLATIHGRPQLVVQTRTTLAGVDPESGKTLWEEPIPSYRGMNILTPLVFDDGIFTSNYRGRSWYYKVVEEAGGIRLQKQWEERASGYMSTPVRVGDHVYMHLQNKRIDCINLRTGQETWRTSESYGEYWSMITQGDRILALDQTGELILMRANPGKFDLIARREVADAETWAHLAMADREIFIRELHAMTAWRWE